LGILHSDRLEVFSKPTRESTEGRYKSCRGPMSEIAAEYLKFREENFYPPLPMPLTNSGLEALAEQDQNPYWQMILAYLEYDPT
jgi:hypothetical protein